MLKTPITSIPAYYGCGRVALGVAPQGSHRSVLAQLRHTAPQVKVSLRCGTLSEPPSLGATEIVAKER